MRSQPEEWWEDIFDRIACGENARAVVKGYCVRFAIFGRVLEEDLARKLEYEAALRISADGLAFETLEILDGSDPENIGVDKARADARWKIASRLHRDRWGERVQVEKVVKIEVDAGLVGFAGELLNLLSAPKEGRVMSEHGNERVVATMALEEQEEQEADPEEEVQAATPTGNSSPVTPPRMPVWEI